MSFILDIYKVETIVELCSFLHFQLDYKVGWKKLKEVFSMAGMVVRADILEDKDGKSRGMGTVTFDMPLEAVQAVCILSVALLNYIHVFENLCATFPLTTSQLCSMANSCSIGSCM